MNQAEFFNQMSHEGRSSASLHQIQRGDEVQTLAEGHCKKVRQTDEACKDLQLRGIRAACAQCLANLYAEKPALQQPIPTRR